MVKLEIEGMTCGHCVMHVKKALTGVVGVGAVEVDLQTGSATVEGDTDPGALVQAVEAEGYTARLA
jgi:copper chaperone